MTEFHLKPEPGKLNAFCAELDAALEAGKISKEQWYTLRKDATQEAYLSYENPRAQSGHSGDEARWHFTRVLMVLEAIHKDGTFLDVGCANGYLVECLLRLVEGSWLKVEFYGLDISEGLIDLARSRLPEQAGRFFAANAVTWTPDRHFDFVHAHEISYAPRNRERQFFEHLLNDYLNPGGRLIIGPWALGRDLLDMEERISSWGYEPTGYLIKSQGDDPGLTRKMLWFDRS
jgi:SAM-dependent methyltransferase